LSVAIASVLASDTFELTTFCASDPPDDPGLNPNDAIAILNPADLNDYLIARQKIFQWWEHIFWYQACQCVGTTTPPLPPPSSPGPGSENPGLPSGPGVQPCFQGSDSSDGQSVLDDGTTTAIFHYLLDALPGSQLTTVNAGFDTRLTTVQAKAIPAGTISNIRMRFTGTRISGTNPWIRMMVYDASHNSLGGIWSQYADGNTFDWSFTVPQLPAGSAYWLPVLTTGGDPPSHYSASFGITYDCSSSPNTPSVPCCPPDPTLEFRINQLFELIIALHTGAGATPPSSWTDGIRHTGLRDSGRLVLAPTAVGVRAEVTSIPPDTQITPGNPTFYWNIGYITPIALDVPLRGARLVFNPQSFSFPVQADGVSWTLLRGTTMNLVELLPAP
jgi:hypothetical protein